MTKNAYLENLIVLVNTGVVKVPDVVISMLRNYSYSNYDDLVVDDLNASVSSKDWLILLSTVIEAGENEFVFAESSSACLSGLCSLFLVENGLSASVKDVVQFKTQVGVKYGLRLHIKVKRGNKVFNK